MRARQTVTKSSCCTSAWPASVEPPFLAPVSSIMGEVLFVDLESERQRPFNYGQSRTPSYAVAACVPASRR